MSYHPINIQPTGPHGFQARSMTAGSKARRPRRDLECRRVHFLAGRATLTLLASRIFVFPLFFVELTEV